MGYTLDPATRDFYRHAMTLVREARVPYLVGGAYALERLTGIVRHTKDIDLFVRPRDTLAALSALSRAGYRTELVHPHWLGKAFSNGAFIDVIFRSGNALVEVDDEWFAYAIDDEVLGQAVRLCPIEEMIWSKAFVMERERFDGADIAHLIRARAEALDWERLVHRFGPHWRVLFTHLVLFGYVYPSERERIPAWVLSDLTERLARDEKRQAAHESLCQGPLLSRSQYLIDLEHWGYEDPRLLPRGRMTAEDIARWTDAIAIDGKD
jgi:hypothetical protein